MNGHSEFQIDHFIVNKGNWTPYGRYKQCQREIRSRESGIKYMELELAEKAIDLEEAKESWKGLSGLDHQRKEIEIQRIELSMEGIRESLATNKRELTRFKRLAEELKPLVKGDENQLDRETWLTKIRVMLAVDLLCNGRPSTNLVTLVLSTPEEFRKTAIEEVVQVVKTIEHGDMTTAIEQTCKFIESN